MEQSGKFITKIVRNENGHPMGIIVALSKDKIGWSGRNQKDKWDADKGYKIALARATNGYRSNPPKHIQSEIERMETRAAHYFDNPNPRKYEKKAK